MRGYFPFETRIEYRPVMLVELSLGRVFYVKTEYSFDEPALKATFASTLIIPSHYDSIEQYAHSIREACLRRQEERQRPHRRRSQTC